MQKQKEGRSFSCKIVLVKNNVELILILLKTKELSLKNQKSILLLPSLKPDHYGKMGLAKNQKKMYYEKELRLVNSWRILFDLLLPSILSSSFLARSE